MISAYLAMDEITLTTEQSDAFVALGAEWCIVNRRLGKQLVSALAPEDKITTILAAMAPYHPRLLGVWDEQGQPLAAYPVRAAEYLEVMPDDITMPANPNDPPIITRPTVARDCCGWAGWSPRIFP
jgi:hypothetical protein